MQDEGDAQTQPCFTEPKQLADDLWTDPPEEKGLDPALVLWAEKATVSVFSSHSHPLTSLPSLPHTLSSFQERSVKKHGILQHSLQVWRGEEGKKAVPPSRADWRHLEALGVRHSSSSFLHWRFYKQVSNAPDLVWQTFSKEHLKKGWESDTPTCACFFFFFSFFGGASRIRSPLTLLLFSFSRFLLFCFFCILYFLLSTLRGLMWSPQLHKKWW